MKVTIDMPDDIEAVTLTLIGRYVSESNIGAWVSHKRRGSRNNRNERNRPHDRQS